MVYLGISQRYVDASAEPHVLFLHPQMISMINLCVGFFSLGNFFATDARSQTSIQIFKYVTSLWWEKDIASSSDDADDDRSVRWTSSVCVSASWRNVMRWVGAFFVSLRTRMYTQHDAFSLDAHENTRCTHLDGAPLGHGIAVFM